MSLAACVLAIYKRQHSTTADTVDPATCICKTQIAKKEMISSNQKKKLITNSRVLPMLKRQYDQIMSEYVLESSCHR